VIIEVWLNGSEPTIIRRSASVEQLSVRKDSMSELRCLIKDEIIIIITRFSGILARQTILSATYLILLLILPYVPLPNSKTIRGSTGRFLTAVVLLSFLNVTAQASFQIYLVSSTAYGQVILPCK